ncbi:MAG TPA: DUF1287 domain-containing protein [Allosphingosinicella sp.]|nr:DUF1287 domain-containing protein [Allosphingosinicella sp.]
MTILDRRTLLIGGGAALALAACGRSAADPAPPPPAPGKAGKLIAAARAQVGVTTRYDSAYTRLAFPGGDVPRERGVCTDVVIRAYRDALGLDLQALVNADMRSAFAAYPGIWGLRGPDRNIDHRRVPNLRTWLKRKGAALPVPAGASGWRPGDIFTSLVDGRSPHIGLVSDRRGPNGWLILHNIGAGTREEEGLLSWPITGRYRWSLD